MKYYGVNELRKMFLDFFESKGHLRANSFSLVPMNDKSLLLINSGMAPLKAYFTGQEIPPRKRMTTCQKCIRTADLENVGKTARHGTFFEMLGNFSFGDYFKSEAIAWAWEFFTQILNIPKDSLYISIYEEDDEAAKIWHEQEGVPKDKIIKMGKEDNFWEHGLGPCGPCSEIYIDRGEKYGCGAPDCKVGCECDRFVEVWNLVFTQYNKLESGEYVPLDHPNIDTGMGLERLAAIMQDAPSIFDIDTIKRLRQEITKKSGKEYGKTNEFDVSIRIITDHVRSMTFMASDGILPSNEGRGYVLRRLIRRAARHGRLLSIKGNFLTDLAEIVIETNKDGYPELLEKRAYILKVLATEEERFTETLDQGIIILNEYIEAIKKSDKKLLLGNQAFKLYDTYGFPYDLTLEIAQENDIQVDEEGFKKEMEAQRKRARDAREETNYMGAKETVYNQLEPEIATKFTGYDTLIDESKIVAITSYGDIVEEASKGDEVTIFVESTPFYAESGGQVGDRGLISTPTGRVQVNDVKKVAGLNIAHFGKLIEGSLSKGQVAKLEVDSKSRRATMKNHSATHLLQKALREVLGEHVEQAGSLVSPERLRFDFTHFQPVTSEEIEKIEDIVNDAIGKGLDINIKEMTMDQAKKLGAMALFGEKYSDIVRVVNMGDYSIELCGGTHLKNSSEIGLFKIVSENGIAAGVRRIEALTSFGAIDYYKKQDQLLHSIASKLKCNIDQVVSRVDQLAGSIKDLKADNEKLQAKLAGGQSEDLYKDKITIKGIDVVISKFKDTNNDIMKSLADQLKEKSDKMVILFAGESQGKALLLSMATDEAIKAGINSGKLIKEISKHIGGGGGGRPNMAQAGGKNPEGIDQALARGRDLIEDQLS